MNYKHFREKNAKFHIFLLLSIMGGISLITIYDRKFRHNRPEEGLPKMITYISPINIVAEDNHLYFAYKFPLGCVNFFIVLTLYCLGFPYIASLAKNFISISEGIIKKFSYGRRDYIYILYIYIYIYIYMCVCESGDDKNQSYSISQNTTKKRIQAVKR